MHFPVGGAAVGAGDAPPLSWRGGGGRRSVGARRPAEGGGIIEFQAEIARTVYRYFFSTGTFGEKRNAIPVHTDTLSI